MTLSPLGAILTEPPPRLSTADAALALRRHWGLRGELQALSSERDANFHLSGPQGDVVLKLANPAEPPQETDLQIRALQHLQTSGLPVPHVVPSLTGAVQVASRAGRLRVVTYLPGLPLHQARKSDAQRAALGRMAARLAAALADFRHPAARRELVWDISNTARLRPLLATIPDEELRAQADLAMTLFQDRLAPALSALPRQVVHNDLNPHNLLVSLDDPDKLCAVLDFGDMVEAPRLLDLGIAASYQIDPARPRESLGIVAAAYHAETPLTRPERQLLPLAVLARLVTTLCIAHERARRQPANAAYILRNVPTSAAALRSMSALGIDPLTQALDRDLP